MDTVSPTVALIFGIVIGIIMWITGGLVIEVNKRAADGRLKRSRIAGLRTKATLASDEAWLAGHTAAHQSTIVAGSLSMASGVVSVVFGVVAATNVMSGSAAMVAIAISVLAGSLLLVAFLLRATIQANRAAA